MYPARLIVTQGEKMVHAKKFLVTWGCHGWRVYIWTTYFIYAIFLLVSQTKFIYDVRKDIHVVSSAIINYAVPIMGLYKAFIVLHFRGKIDKMHVTIKEDFLDLLNVRNEISKKVCFRLMLIDRTLKVFFGTALAVCLFIVIHPPANFPEGQRPLPAIVWLPFNQNPSPLHEILYVIFGVGHHIMAVAIIIHDINFLYFTQSLSVQFIILKELLREVCEVQDFDDDGNYDSVYYQAIINDRINDCIKRHVLLIGFYKDVKAIFSLSLFFQFGFSIILTVFTNFMLQMDSNDTIETLTLFGFDVVLFLQTIHTALSGSELEYQSETVASAVYCSRWYFGKKPFRKALNILQMNSQRPVKISGAGLVYVNNTLMVTIYKTVFSLLTLINRLVD